MLALQPGPPVCIVRALVPDFRFDGWYPDRQPACRARCSLGVLGQARGQEGGPLWVKKTASRFSLRSTDLFLFNDAGDCLAAKLRPGNVASADDGDELLLPELERQQAEGKHVASGRTPPARNPRSTRRWRRGASTMTKERKILVQADANPSSMCRDQRSNRKCRLGRRPAPCRTLTAVTSAIERRES